MTSGLEEFKDLMEDKSDEGKQARQSMGMLFHYRIQSMMDDTDAFLKSGRRDALKHAYHHLKTVFGKISWFLSDTEREEIENVMKQCELNLVAYERYMFRYNQNKRYANYNPPTDLDKSIYEFDRLMNDALNSHNLNLPVKPSDSNAGDDF